MSIIISFPGALCSPWRFTNAYDIDEFSAHKPLFTTKTDLFEGWIDHVWVNSGVVCYNLFCVEIYILYVIAFMPVFLYISMYVCMFKV